MDRSALVIFCRRPAPGIGKQRIAAELGKAAAKEVGELLLAATLEDARGWDGAVILSPANVADELWAQECMPRARVVPQPDGNLGERIEYVHRLARDAGNDRVIFIGTDAPALTPAILAEASAGLDTHDTVIIPARDGGVTLLGTRLTWPALATLPWETHELGAQLIDRCRNAGHHVLVMPTSSDVDTRQDLIDTYASLENDRRPARIQLRNWIIRAGLIPSTGLPADAVSVIIPVLNDSAALARLLQRLTTLKPAANEIIVVDSSISDACKNLAAAYGALYLRSEPNRGRQLRLGAEAASCNILWFLHADGDPPANSIELIRQHVRAGHTSGYFRFRFDGPHRWYKHCLERAINWRTRFGIPYGDQGLFAVRNHYFAAGGHAATPLFEEVPLIRALRAAAGCTEVAGTISVSSRRWERDGWLRRSLHNRCLAIAFAMGVAPDRLARHYGRTAKTN